MRSATSTPRSVRDRIAPIVDTALPLIGVAIVLAAVILGGGGWGALWMAVAGLLLVEAGVWRLGSRLVYERRYMPLRREMQRFVGFARELHHHTLAVREAETPEARQSLDRTVGAMRDSLDRMVAVAGRTDQDLEDAAAKDDTTVASSGG